MTKLRISDSLSLPLDFVTQTAAILAIRALRRSPRARRCPRWLLTEDGRAHIGAAGQQ